MKERSFSDFTSGRSEIRRLKVVLLKRFLGRIETEIIYGKSEFPIKSRGVLTSAFYDSIDVA